MMTVRLWNFRAVLLLVLYNMGVEGGTLMTSRPSTRQQISCCKGMSILSCDKIKIDLNVLGDEDLYLEPLNTTLQYQGLVSMSSNSYHYSNKEVDFILTANLQLGSVYGHAAFENGKSYVIEFCGDNVHVLKELDVENMVDAEGVDTMDNNTNTTNYGVKRQAVRDTTTVVIYSIKVYYTPQFAATTADIRGFVEQLIQETNVGYDNSKVPLRAKLHCTELATLNDVYSAETMIDQFTAMKGDYATLRGTADAAVLLVNSMDICGKGWINAISTGQTFSVTRKDCALGFYIFAHELGHNFGLYHNREISYPFNPFFSDGHGYLIPKGSASSGFSTIMAYPTDNNPRFANYYSNPDVIHPTTGSATGIAGQANNARVLTVQRFAFASIGDESSTSGCSAPPSCRIEGKYQYFQHEFKGRFSESSCNAKCKSNAECQAWIYYGYVFNWYGSCYFLVRKQTYSTSYSHGPDLTEKSCNMYKPSSCRSTNSIPYVLYIGSSSASSSEVCQIMCELQSSCTQWIYRKSGSSGTCFKYQFYNQSRRGWTSGPRFC